MMDKDPRIEKLHRAAELGDIGAVVDFFESEIDVDAADAVNSTALMCASQRGHIDLIRLLLDRGASFTSRDRFGHSALTYAVERWKYWGGGEPDSPERGPLELLLAAGARYELPETLLLDDLALARALLDEGADPDTGRGSYHGSLLMIAAGRGQFEMVDLLLARGADIEATDDIGRRPLLHAASRGRIAVVSRLLERGAEIDASDWSFQTALSEAAVAGHRGIVELLLARGAARGLLDAVALDDFALVEELLKEECDADQHRYVVGRLAMYAAGRGNAAIVGVLLDHGATHYHEIFDEHPLLAEAARCGHVEVARLLLARGAEVNETGRDGKTALEWAIEGGHTAVIDCLREAGAASENSPLVRKLWSMSQICHSAGWNG